MPMSKSHQSRRNTPKSHDCSVPHDADIPRINLMPAYRSGYSTALRPLGTRPALTQATAALSYRSSSGSMQHTWTGSSLTFLRKPYDIQRNRQPSRPLILHQYCQRSRSSDQIWRSLHHLGSQSATPLSAMHGSHGRRHPHRTARPTPAFQALQPPSPQSLLTANLGSSGEMTKQFAIDSEPSSHAAEKRFSHQVLWLLPSIAAAAIKRPRRILYPELFSVAMLSPLANPSSLPPVRHPLSPHLSLC